MADRNQSRLGMFSGVVAGVMVIALTVMAFVAFDEPVRVADMSLPAEAIELHAAK